MNPSRRQRSAGLPGSVRIIGGDWRGTRLVVPDLGGLRPTADRVRETLFNWLQPKLAGACVLDLFAGSGALGFESVSRGAGGAILVERDPQLVEALRRTCARLPGGERVQVACAEALAWLRAPAQQRFDVVFVDPPFGQDLWAPALAALPPWLADDAWLYLESPRAAPVGPGPDWRLHREGQTRDVHYALFRRSA